MSLTADVVTASAPARQAALLRFIQSNEGLSALEIARTCESLYGRDPGFLVLCCRDLRVLHKGMAISRTEDRPERWYA